MNETAASKIVDENGEVGKDDFIKFAQDSKLLDFGNAMGADVLGLGGGGLVGASNSQYQHQQTCNN